MLTAYTQRRQELLLPLPPLPVSHPHVLLHRILRILCSLFTCSLCVHCTDKNERAELQFTSAGEFRFGCGVLKCPPIRVRVLPAKPHEVRITDKGFSERVLYIFTGSSVRFISGDRAAIKCTLCPSDQLNALISKSKIEFAFIRVFS